MNHPFELVFIARQANEAHVQDVLEQLAACSCPDNFRGLLPMVSKYVVEIVSGRVRALFARTAVSARRCVQRAHAPRH